MVGSAAIGAVIVKVVFLVLLGAGWWGGDVSPRALAVLAMAGLWAWTGLAGTTLGPGVALAVLAAVDIVLVLLVRGGDIRLT